jgi:hypothetical protein
MNAVLRECAADAVNDRDDQAVQIAELRADVRHIQSDITDVKAEVRATNQRIDELKDSLASAKFGRLGCTWPFPGRCFTCWHAGSSGYNSVQVPPH